MSLGGTSSVLFTKDLSILRESDGDKASVNLGKNQNNNGIKKVINSWLGIIFWLEIGIMFRSKKLYLRYSSPALEYVGQI